MGQGKKLTINGLKLKIAYVIGRIFLNKKLFGKELAQVSDSAMMIKDI